MGLATLTVVPNELEAEMICGKLRANGVDCSYRQTDIAAGAFVGTLASGGPVAVVVDDSDIEYARTLLPPTD